MHIVRLACLGAALVALAPATRADPAFGGLGPSALGTDLAAQIVRGRQIAPVPLAIRDGVNPLSVWLGSYIVNGVADCNGCHSNNPFTPGHNPFQGQPKQLNAACYLNGGQVFGPFVSRNITPDASGRPAGRSFATFVNLMKTGNDPQDPGTLLQVMPWDTFQNMTITDLRAIYDYLSAIPALADGNAASGPCASPPPPS